MKIAPRTRAKADLYELDRDSGYLIMFKNDKNAHLYTKSGVKKPKTKKPKSAKKSSAPKAKKASPKAASGFKSAFGAFGTPAFGFGSVPPPLTKQQSQNALTLARQGSQTHRWEFVNDSGNWSKYLPEASKLVEMEYQSWQQQPSVFVRSVRSGDWHYSVNFNQMEQTNINHPGHRVRKIRRVANI
eukprot:GILI01009954.1.p1 GENE.GILI01009954.1~~GILI01009954.1.p1  ORF type:complete len:186 (+),score=39.40 GILI01009954.1:49-606(+)